MASIPFNKKCISDVIVSGISGGGSDVIVPFNERFISDVIVTGLVAS